MSYYNSYQEDSSATKQIENNVPVLIKDNNNSANIQNEISEQQDSLSLVNADTFYGIENESLLPYRAVTDQKNDTLTVVEVLFSPTKNKLLVESWQTILLLIAIMLIGLTKAIANNRFKQSVRALINYSVAQEINREEKVFFHRGNILATIIYVITASLFVYHLKQVVNNSVLEEDNLLFFVLIVGSILTIYLVKYLFSKILFFIFGEFSVSSEYIFNVSLYNNLLGILLAPLLSIAYFTSLEFSIALTYLFIPLLILIFLLRVIRLFIIGITKGISFVYIFLYICTLEILPLVVLYSIFIIK